MRHDSSRLPQQQDGKIAILATPSANEWSFFTLIDVTVISSIIRPVLALAGRSEVGNPAFFAFRLFVCLMMSFILLYCRRGEEIRKKISDGHGQGKVLLGRKETHVSPALPLELQAFSTLNMTLELAY